MVSRIVSGDEVVVLSGDDKGRVGKVVRVLYCGGDVKKVVVSGVNICRKSQRSTQTKDGGIVESECPIDASKVAVLDPELRVQTKVGVRKGVDGKMVRFAKLSGKELGR